MSSPVLILSGPSGETCQAVSSAIAQGINRLQPSQESTCIRLDGRVDFYRRLSVWQNRVTTLVSGLKPLGIVCTHPIAAQAAGELRLSGGSATPVFAVLSHFTFDPLWVHPGIDLYFAPNHESAANLSLLGVPGDQIKVTGIPISPEFFVPKRLLAVASRVHSREKPTVLVDGSCLARCAMKIGHLEIIGNKAKVVILAGNHSGLLNKTRVWRLTGRPWITAYGFRGPIGRLMREADIFVTKAEGVACSQALALGLPLAIYEPSGSQDSGAHYLVRHGAALSLADPMQLATTVASLVSDESWCLTQFAEASSALGRPHAALEVAGLVLDQSQSRANKRQPEKARMGHFESLSETLLANHDQISRSSVLQGTANERGRSPDRGRLAALGGNCQDSGMVMPGAIV